MGTRHGGHGRHGVWVRLDPGVDRHAVWGSSHGSNRVLDRPGTPRGSHVAVTHSSLGPSRPRVARVCGSHQCDHGNGPVLCRAGRVRHRTAFDQSYVDVVADRQSYGRPYGQSHGQSHERPYGQAHG